MNGPAFGRGTTAGLVLVGLLCFVALLYWLGNGAQNANNGGGHVGGRGLNGFAALAAMMEADGLEVRRARRAEGLREVGLLVLTPPPYTDGKAIARIVNARRAIGPTLIIAPKWFVAPAFGLKGARRGWTRISGAGTPEWPGFADNVTVALGDAKAAPAHGWRSGARSGPLPDDRTVLSGRGAGLRPLVRAGDGRVLAAYLGDDGYYPAFDGLADEPSSGENTDIYPVVLVFEPDLLDNWGLADRRTGLLARQLMLAAAGTRSQPVVFDLTLNGLGGSRNLLTLAFQPPFLAATLCLLLAMLAVIWRGFNRFGPARRATPDIATGKAALVANTAGLIRRAGRLHLIAAPYAADTRGRIAARLGLARGLRGPAADGAAIEHAIDRAMARRGLAHPPFSTAADRLRAARRPDDVARAAADLQRIEKDLMQ